MEPSVTAINQELQSRLDAALERHHKAREQAAAAMQRGDRRKAAELVDEANRSYETVRNLMRQQHVPRC